MSRQPAFTNSAKHQGHLSMFNRSTQLCAFFCLAASGSGQIFNEPAPPGNVQSLNVSGNIIPGGTVTITVTGPPGSTIHLGFATDSAYINHPVGVVLIGLENFTASTDFLDATGTYAVTFTNIPFAPVGATLYIQGLIIAPDNTISLTNRSRGIFQGQVNNLTIQPLGSFNVNVGSTLTFNVATAGGQGVPVLSVASPMPLTANMTFDAASGNFSFQPDLSQVGTNIVIFNATDAVESTMRQATITVNAPMPGALTQLSGVMKDATSQLPLPNVTIMLAGGTPSTLSAADGSFTLSGLPSGVVPIVFNGQTAGDYPFLPEPLTLFPGVNNVIDRPVFLPFLDTPSGTLYSPSTTASTSVTSPNVPDTELEVMPNSVLTPSGQPFTGTITIVPVPPANAPLGLPPGMMPNQLISIQPGGVQFNPPAQLTWPNDDGYPVGTVLEIWSANEETGGFEKVGDAAVQALGMIKTTAGGVVVGSWHFVIPPPPTLPPELEGMPLPEVVDPKNARPICGNSWTEAATGILHETHTTPPYRTMGIDRFITLQYNSATADTRALVFADVTIPAASAVPLTMSACATVGGVAGSRSFINTSSLPENPDQTVRAVAQLPLSGVGTGLYDYTLELATHFPATSRSLFVMGKAPIVGRQASEVGTGWAIDGIDRLYPQADGSVMLVQGDGNTLTFRSVSPVTGGLKMQMFNTTNPFSALSNQFVGMTPGNFTVTTANAAPLTVNSFIVPTVNFPFAPFAAAAFYNVGPNGTVQGSAPTTPLGDDISFQPPGGNDTFGARFSGYVHLPTGGNVTFSVYVDDACTLRVNGQLLISQTSSCGFCTLSGTLTNAPAGWLPIQFDYVENTGNARVGLQAVGGGLPGGLIPAAFLSTTPGPPPTFPFLLSPVNEFSTLVHNNDGTYTRTLPNGSRDQFSASGVLTARLDRSNNLTSFAYDALGRLTAITDPVGQLNPAFGQTTFTYAGAFLSQITYPGPNGPRSTTLSHDATGRLVSITDPDGSIRTFSYDSAGRMTSQTNKLGFPTVYGFDSAGRNVYVIRADGSTATIASGNGTFVANPVTGVATNTSPAPAVTIGNVYTRYVNGVGAEERYTLDYSGRSTKEVDALGRITLIERGPNGLPTMVTRADGSVVVTAYDLKGNPMLIVEEGDNGPSADDRTWTFEYDPVLNVLTSVTDPMGNVNSTGVTTRITYDALGRPISVRNALDMITTFAYDEAGLGASGLSGQLTTVVAAVGTPEQAVTQFAYDAQGRIQESTDPAGRKIAYTYNGAGLVHSVTVKGSSASTSDDQTTTYLYDAAGNVTSITDALGGVTTLTYTPEGRVASVQDAKPVPGITSYAYDLRGRLLSRTDPLGAVESYFYGGESDLLQFVDRKGQVFNWTYDAAGRVLAKTRPRVGGGTETVGYAYQMNSDNLAAVTDNDSAVTFTWNAFGELVATATAATANQAATLITYAYDKNGNRSSMNGVEGGQTFTSVSYTADALDRLTSLNDATNGVQATFQYDALSRRTRLDRTAPGMNARSCYAYNAAGDLLSLEHRYNPGAGCGSGALLSKFVYGYNALGLHDAMTEDRPAFGITAATHVYAYDPLNRLVSAAHPNDPAEAFTYDPVGNRLTSGPNPILWQYNVADALLNDGTATYGYDLNGNRAAKTVTASSVATSYSYDAENLLVGASQSGAALTAQFHDGLNRRTETTDSVTTTYVYDGLDAALIRQGANATRVVFGPGIDEPLFYISGSTVHLPIADALGSITEEVAAGGTFSRARRYATFGGVTAITGTAQPAPFGFTAREFDASVSLQHARARHLDSNSGRFTQQDPAGFGGGNMNLFAYAGNAPTTYTDPLGEFLWLPILAAAATSAIIDVGFQLANNGGNIDCIDKTDVALAALTGATLSGLGPTGFLLGRGGPTAFANGYARNFPYLNGGASFGRDFRFGWGNLGNKENLLRYVWNGVKHDLRGTAISSAAAPIRDGAVAGLFGGLLYSLQE
jgi:RHS repeat-associated protein